MQKPDRSSFTVLDFQSWEETGTLSLAPKFQRRSVWKLPARTYLIDTLLKGMPTPPIYLRITQNDQKTRTIREVIDGQQRLRAVLDYAKDDFTLAKSVSEMAPGKRFSQLSEEQRDQIRKYSFICEAFSSISDAEVLEIFARMNTYSVKLNGQELRNGRFFGPFKRACYRLAHEHLEFWRKTHIFTDSSIARMLEVELVSELLVAQIDGAQDKKKSLDAFYAKFDETFADEQKLLDRFRASIDAISVTFGDSLSKTEFRRPPLFYTLFCVVYHRMFSMPKAKATSPKSGRLNKDDSLNLRDAALLLSERLESAREDEPVPQTYATFIQACLQQTDNIRPREIRFEAMYKRAFK
jgi:uncharacterized protein DUF262